MRHLGTQTLHTPRLTLRPFSREDGAAMYRNWASDPEVTRFLSWPTPPLPGRQRRYLRRMGRQGRRAAVVQLGYRPQ